MHMTENMRGARQGAKAFLTGTVIAVLMAATAFAATTPPIRSGEYKAPTRAGYEFQGWYLNPEGTGDMVIDKDGNWLVDIPEDAEVFAKWQQPPTTLIAGKDFSKKLKALSGQSDAAHDRDNSTITSFQKANSIPNGMTMNNTNLISTSDSAFPVYAWFDNGTIYWYSDAENINMNADSQNMFSRFRRITSIDISEFKTSKVTTMKGMFSVCDSLVNLDVSGFDTSNVTNMQQMFYGCYNLTNLDVSEFDTSKVTDMYGMFSSCKKLSGLDVSGFDTSKVTDMRQMFFNCKEISNLDVSRFDTSKITDMERLFSGCSSLTGLDISGFDTSNVTNMFSMFCNCSGLINLDVSGIDTSSVTNMALLFSGCENLTSIDVRGFDTSNVQYMNDMFKNCRNLTSLDVSAFDTSKVTNMSSMFEGCRGITSLDLSGFNTSKVTNMAGMFKTCLNVTVIYVSELWSTSAITGVGSRDMFAGCAGLPNYRYSEVDRSKAHYGEGGYLTYKAAPTNP